jgi:hypothetical protein
VERQEANQSSDSYISIFALLRRQFASCRFQFFTMVTNWKSTLETGHDLVVAKYLCMICLGAIVVDFAHSFRFDYNLLFRKDKTKNKSKGIKWPQVCYLLCKFFYLPYWTVTFVREPSYRVNCQITITISEVLMGVITCLCSALLAFRVLCIWQHRCGNMVNFISANRLDQFADDVCITVQDRIAPSLAWSPGCMDDWCSRCHRNMGKRYWLTLGERSRRLQV